MNIELISLAMTLTFSLLCTFKDLKDGIVKNAIFKYLGLPLALLNLVNIYFNGTANWPDYGLFLAVGAIISLLLFYTHIWAGADCKFYGVVIVMLPYNIVVGQIYGLSNIVVIPMLAFLYGYIYILVESIWEFARHKKQVTVWTSIKKDFLRYLKTYFLLVLINGVLGIGAMKLLHLVIPNVLLLVLDYGLVVMANKFCLLENKVFMALVLLSDVILQLTGLTMVLSFMNLLIWVAVILALTLRNFANSFNYRTIELASLEKGMILSTMSSMYLANQKQKLFKKISDESLHSRLDEQDVIALQQLAATGKGISEVSVVKKIPFILFIFLGVITVLIIGGL